MADTVTIENGTESMNHRALVRRVPWATILVVAAGAVPANALDLGQAVADGTTDLGLRYRFEQVDQDGIDKQAKASTARARLTWNSKTDETFTFGIETDYAFVVGIEDFNSSANGRTDYPLVADPEGLDLNQAFVRYAASDLTVTVGRQRINHGSQRFLGGVAYRQNEQTYDGLRVQNTLGAVHLDYGYLHNINRIFGPGDGAQPGDWFGNSHVFRATAAPGDGHTIAAFAYLLDFENANGPANSNATYGVDYQGVFDRLTITAAVARQSDWADNPVAYDAAFYEVQADVKLDALTLTAGVQSLGSDAGGATFRTPLGTLHKFQGWTDKFLIPPPTGVRDIWFSVSGKLGDATVTGAYHTFAADHGGADYGTEAGASVVYPLRDNVSFLFKVAQYAADSHATDTTKVWLMLDWKL